MTEAIVIAIDGPAGSGKSTVAAEVARRLDLPHVDTGAIYRALTLKALNRKVPADDGPALANLAANSDIDIKDGRIFLDGVDVSREIRSGGVTNIVSRVAAHPDVRRELVEKQRRLVAMSGAVVEGRDVGTVVLPDADLKVYLTAEAGERARRRAAELRSDGTIIDDDRILAQISERDHLDSSRSVSPLKAADNAIEIDSTGLTPAEVVGRIVEIVKEITRP